MSGKKGMKPYPLSIKEQAVRMFIEEGITKKRSLEFSGLQIQIVLRDGLLLTVNTV